MLIGHDPCCSQYLPDAFALVSGGLHDIDLTGAFACSFDDLRVELVPCCGNVILGVLELLLGIFDSLERGIVCPFRGLKVIQHEAILACLYQAKCKHTNYA